MKNEKIKLVELFGGLGSFRKSLENLNYKVDCDYVENDKFAVQAYNLLFKENAVPIDIKNYSYKDNKKIDILSAGFPCQDISQAGKQDLKTGRSMLYKEIIKIIKEININHRPNFIIIENVKQLAAKKFQNIFNDLINAFKKLNYNYTYKILNATDFGIPQTRERLFLIFFKNYDQFLLFNWNFLEKKKLKNISNFLDKEVDDNFFIKEDVLKKYNTSKYFKHYNNWLLLKNNILEYVVTDNVQLKWDDKLNYKLHFLNDWKNNINLPLWNFKTSNIINLNKIRTLLTTKDIPKILIPIYEIDINKNKDYKIGGNIGLVSDEKKILIPFKNYNRDNQCTIATGGGIIKTIACSGINVILEEIKNFYPGRLVLKIENRLYFLRKLTANEYLRFQGWDESSINLLSNNIAKSQIYKLAGNSIVINCIEAILKEIF